MNIVEVHSPDREPIKADAILRNVVVGLTVSFVALSLGAALGMLSGRGAFAGMVSAGLIALITSLFGGTRIQCSGPTAPMSAVTAVTVAYAHERFDNTLGMTPDQFVNLALVVCGLMLVVMGLLHLGRFIRLVPNVVISGFMNGIAVLIWLDQLRLLLGFGGKRALAGPFLENLAVTTGTLVMIFALSPLMRRVVGPRARYLPATLVAIVIATLAAAALHLPIEHLQLTGSMTGFGEFGTMLLAQWPRDWSWPVLLMAAPLALQLALLCYLDTLLTSLVIDKMSGEATRQDKELCAQGVANAAVAMVGGIPGAQATIRSVLMLKEKATLRLAGVMVGVFVLVELVLFQDLITMIPKAVFVGVLLKVGWDVFDSKPVRLYAEQVAQKRTKLFSDFFARHDDEPIFVTNREMLMILGTTLVTVLVDLNTAVVVFTVLFYLHNRVLNRRNPMRDLKPEIETESFTTQN